MTGKLLFGCRVLVGYAKGSYAGYQRSLPVYVEIRVSETGDCRRISITGDIYTPRMTDAVAGGQIVEDLETLLEKNMFKKLVVPREVLAKLIDVWKRWHLNDMRPGTPRQMEALRRAGLDYADYEKQVEYLKSIGLYEDNGVRYGEKWLCEDPPEEVIEFLEYVCKNYGGY